eukprot:Platyproteum_vivax@DN7274_c0_g1_i1.p1
MSEVAISKSVSNVGGEKKKYLSDKAGAYIILLVATVCMTPDSLLFKLTTHIPIGGHLLIRHCVALVPLSGYWLLCEKKDLLWRGGWLTLFNGAIFAGINLIFPVAISYTAAGSATGILATNTVIGSIFFLIIFRELPAIRLVITQVLSIVGVILIFVADRKGSGTLGNILAFVMAVLIAIFLVGCVYMMETKPGSNIIAPVYIATFLIIAISPALGFNLTSSVVNKIDWLYMVLGGAIAMPALYTTFVYPSRYLHPSEIAVVLLSEVVLGPLWVYLGVGEVPKTLAIAGMGIVFVALLFNAIGAFVLEKWEEEQAQKWRDYRDKRWPPKVKKEDVEAEKTGDVESGVELSPVTEIETGTNDQTPAVEVLTDANQAQTIVVDVKTDASDALVVDAKTNPTQK